TACPWTRSDPSGVLGRLGGVDDGGGDGTSVMCTPRSPSHPATASRADAENDSVPAAASRITSDAATTLCHAGRTTGPRALRDRRPRTENRGGTRSARSRLATEDARSVPAPPAAGDSTASPTAARARSSCSNPSAIDGLLAAERHAILPTEPLGASRPLELRPKPRESSGRPRLDRAPWAAQRLRHLDLREVEPVPVRDQQPVVGAEVVDRGDQLPPPFLREGRPFRRWGRILREAALGSSIHGGGRRPEGQ